MFQYRAQRIDGKGEVVGSLLLDRAGEHILGYYIIDMNADIHRQIQGHGEFQIDDLLISDGGWHKIDPATLAMSTGQLDSTGKMIFSCVEYDNGKISKSGDMLECPFTPILETYPDIIYGEKRLERDMVIFKNGYFTTTKGRISLCNTKHNKTTIIDPATDKTEVGE